MFRSRSTVRYLADRMSWRPGETGISSDAMVREAIGGDPVSLDEYPWDDSDLGRCVLTIERAPRHLRRTMRPILSSFKERLQQERIGSVGPRPPAPPIRLRPGRS